MAVTFDLEKMKRHIASDKHLTFVWEQAKDGMRMGLGDEGAMRVMFNSYVVGDSVAERVYESGDPGIYAAMDALGDQIEAAVDGTLALRVACRRCRAPAGQKCKNYKGQNKQTCPERGTPEPPAAPVKQPPARSLFED